MEMFFDKFIHRTQTLKSHLCIGLDPELEKIPHHLKTVQEPLYKFCSEIVDATHDFASAYKPNIAFFERHGSRGFLEFEKTVQHIQSVSPDVPIIADIKRSDIGNTAKEYARFYFNQLKLDAVTLSPYMGIDSIEPFLEIGNGTVFLLCLTSNIGSSDFQRKRIIEDEVTKSNSRFYLYEVVADFANRLNQKYKNRVGIVLGANHIEELGRLRLLFQDLMFLIPGYGAQGGKLSDIIKVCGERSVINSSRAILYNSQNIDFADRAREMAFNVQLEMKELVV